MPRRARSRSGGRTFPGAQSDAADDLLHTRYALDQNAQCALLLLRVDEAEDLDEAVADTEADEGRVDPGLRLDRIVDGVLQRTAILAARREILSRRARERTHHIGSADDADKLAVAQNRNPS